MASLVRVQSIKRVMVVTLVALWALASNLCRLELISGLSFMACSQQDDCAGQQDKDCETDGCATVENQLYKAETTQQSMPAPVLLFAFFLTPLLDVFPFPKPSATSCLMLLQRSWPASGSFPIARRCRLVRLPFFHK